jgi:hypothetical protein
VPWAGAQWKTSSQGKPAFGWVGIGRPPLDKPRGLIEIETAYGPTPSTAAILARLRTAGGGATYSTTKGLMLAGFHGQQIDGLSGTQIHPSCGSGVFVDQSAESVAAVELVRRTSTDGA